MFLETYGGDYTRAPSNDDLRKFMMAKTYDENADEKAIAPQFMELIISAADTWRKLDNSLSSSIIQKMCDGFRVYYVYMNYGLFRSIFNLFCLSINFLKKN